MTSIRTSAAIVLLLTVCACKVGPNYKRPAVTVPDQYRGLAPDPSTQPAGQPFADMQWASVFQDEVLQGLIKEALTNNYDIRIAATRVLQANANLGITRADQFPSLGGSAAITNERNALYPGAPTFDTLGLSLNYIVDFWGQYRRATESARATLLATQYGQSVVQTSLITSVATDYFLLRQYDDELAFSKKTVEADNEILKLNQIKFKGGESAITDVYQAQALVEQAEAQVITTQQAIEQTENNISILLGRNPGPIARGLGVTEQPHPPDVPAGLPSALLQRRPDVRRAEENLVAANANVGVAKAAFFPQISLTAAFGAQSTAITSFLQGPATFWAIGGQAVQPIFEGGRIRSSYHLAWAQRDEADLLYKQTVQQAFGEVSNSLVGYSQSRLYRMKIEEQTKTYKQMADLANVRFQGGVTSFLEVQYYEQQYFNSALSLSQAWFAELQYYAQLYQSLGGGWQP
ncbi:MAG TPA: efflux transporter outer membrane subunit [Candidatus Limnocylindrales bacterium]|jgi:multidrug efflux system outer membrane protein|nr:efflux transporter outer membrane subunit [Candidatus Limnocylindrales bacterium]